LDTSSTPAYERRDPDGSEMIPLARRILQAEGKEWYGASSICTVEWTDEVLLLVSSTRDAFVAIYFEGRDQQNRQLKIGKVVSNGNTAALAMLLQLVWHFKV
jgi:hypothetical protein